MRQRAILIRNVRPDMYGGGETYQLMLAQELLKNNIEPVIVTSSNGLFAAAKKEGIKTVRAPFCNKQNWSGFSNVLLPVYIIWQFRLKRWYKRLFTKYRPAAINVQSRDDFIAASKAARKMGIRVLWTDHMDFRSWMFKNINIKHKNLIGKWVLREMQRVDTVIMISEFERKWLIRQVGVKKCSNITVIKNGVIDKYGNYKNVTIVLQSFVFVGRIVDYKGIFELISAFEIVNKKYPDARLEMYGEGEGLGEYKELAKANHNICFHGYTNDPLRAMAENEIFVLPSYCEGLSLSLLDAAMMNKKIIASNVDGNPEVVIDKETGLLVPAKDTKKLANAMFYMLENKKTAQNMADNARRFYENNFDFEKTFKEKMLPLYYNKGKE